MLNYPNRTELQNPRSYKVQFVIWGNERDMTTVTKMGNVNMNHEPKLLYNQTDHITFNLDSIECTSVFSDVCGLWVVYEFRITKSEEWEMREDVFETVFAVTNI